MLSSRDGPEARPEMSQKFRLGKASFKALLLRYVLCFHTRFQRSHFPSFVNREAL